MTEENNKNFFLNSAKLAGYKSIENVEIDLVKGLNIIIGKNAAGKTNFLTFLKKSFNTDFKDLNNFTAELNFQSDKELQIKSHRNLKIKELLLDNNLEQEIETAIWLNRKKVRITKNKKTVVDIFKEHKMLFNSIYISHGVPQEYLIVEQPLTVTFDKIGEIPSGLAAVIQDKSIPQFVRCFALDLLIALGAIDNVSIEEIKKEIEDCFKSIESISNILNRYSIIQDIRLSNNYNIFISEDSLSFSVTNIFFEFKIDGNWLPFSSLSDGTKRLFYIISELFNYNSEVTNLRTTSFGLQHKNEFIGKIILIEEPELGVHPHQFKKLMDYISEQSKYCQIILTTHSPQALNVIEQDDLDRIILAFSTSKGTNLRHLTLEEKKKASQYIEEDFLGDYWVYSDLEQV